MKNNKYYPHRKENNDSLYINIKSNHPPTILKQLPLMIGERLSNNSCNQHEFDKAKHAYEKALEKSGFEERLRLMTVQGKESDRGTLFISIHLTM